MQSFFSYSVLAFSQNRHKRQHFFFHYLENLLHPAIRVKMQEQLKIHGFKGRISTENNPNTVALEIIIDKLEKNEIKVAIFILPRHQMFLDTVPHIEMINFFDNIDQIKGKTDVQIYSLFDKYAEQEIWQDHVHVTNGPKGIIYSEDVIKMIIQELIT